MSNSSQISKTDAVVTFYVLLKVYTFLTHLVVCEGFVAHFNGHKPAGQLIPENWMNLQGYQAIHQLSGNDLRNAMASIESHRLNYVTKLRKWQPTCRIFQVPNASFNG